LSEAGWTKEERGRALAEAEREGVDLLVVGGGITGAAVLRDAASRGLRALLVEREDFAAGTSSRSSKLIHGGFRYIAEGQLGVVREACRERDRLLRLDPYLVEPLPFLFPSFEGGKYPLWQVRAGLFAYAALASFRRTARFRMLGPEEVAGYCPALRRSGLRGAGLYTDGQTDDARLVLETLRSARRLGLRAGARRAEAVSRAEIAEFLRDADGKLIGASVRDRSDGRLRTVRAAAVVNAAGPAAERVRGLDRPERRPELRPAKGVHLALSAERIAAAGAITFEAADGRQLFLAPWGEVSLLGTTDSWSDEIDAPAVTIEEVHYLLDAANAAFPGAGLNTNDIRSVYAGVRPLASEGEADGATPPSSVSREHRVWEDASGLISAVGGKLTTHRAMGEALVDRALARLPRERRAQAGRSRTWSLPLREEALDAPALAATLRARFDLDARVAAHLARSCGAEAEALLAATAPEEHRPIGGSRHCAAELRFVWRHECPATLCDLLERRTRVALRAAGQGLPELSRLAEVAGEEAGWDEARRAEEMASYAASVRRHYQIADPRPSRRAA
jgi:glycerol-3-phosphate dehydrogenase